MTRFAVGSLVKARNREWVVLPSSTDELLILRPLAGMDHEVSGILTAIEKVEQASFSLPTPDDLGDYRSCKLLRDALRIGFRSSAGPFRSFASIAVEPRPYQIVPLLMALKQETVRLMIADDVGIGKTIEACLIAKELIERGEVSRLAILCPPHLAEQWQSELESKFHIFAELVLSSTISKLERDCATGQSVFDLYPFVIVSLDYIKSDKHHDDFVRACPELVIVDEAHTCAYGVEGKGTRQQRHRLLKELASDPNRHLILVTATPHSGKEADFRSLLGLLRADFNSLPEDLSGPQNEKIRRQLAQHLVQRRRPDIRSYLGTETIFPDRDESEQPYKLSEPYRIIFKKAIELIKSSVQIDDGNKLHQRVRWWSALALLRSMASSPLAASETLRTRSAGAELDSPELVDELGQESVLDLDNSELTEVNDMVLGADSAALTQDEQNRRRKMLDLAREIEGLSADQDEKLQSLAKTLKPMLKDGWRPIVFCRYISTVEYLARELRKVIPNDVEIAGVTGLLPASERETRVQELGKAKKHLLICTDCLSEGINLQDHFDAVLHYDLAWNPTRHEQREGRIDRYGQTSETVKVVTYYSTNNQIDGIVLDILLRKHQTIRKSLGISVAIPINQNKVIEAILEGLLLKDDRTGWEKVDSLMLPGFEEIFKPQKDDLHRQWDVASDREKRSRTMFAQESIKVDDVMQELSEVQEATGLGINVRDFFVNAMSALKATQDGSDVLAVNVSEAPGALKDLLSMPATTFKVKFELPVKEGTHYISRTHPIMENLASYVLDNALDSVSESIAKRAGVIRTHGVDKKTTVLLMRYRYQIITRANNKGIPLLAEDCRVVGYTGSATQPAWLDSKECAALLLMKPDQNTQPDQARHFIEKALGDIPSIQGTLNEQATANGKTILDSHQRVRAASKLKGVSYRIEPKLPPDILGVYVYLPIGAA